MIARKTLEVLVDELVSRAEDDRRSELHRTATGVELAIAPSKGTCGGQGGTRRQRLPADRTSPDDGGSGAVFVQEHREWELLLFDECLGVALPSRADRGDTGAGRQEIVLALTSLTGSLSTGQSAEVAQKEEHVRLLGPQVAQTTGVFVRVDHDLVGELGDIERHFSVSGVAGPPA